MHFRYYGLFWLKKMSKSLIFRLFDTMVEECSGQEAGRICTNCHPNCHPGIIYTSMNFTSKHGPMHGVLREYHLYKRSECGNKYLRVYSLSPTTLRPLKAAFSSRSPRLFRPPAAFSGIKEEGTITLTSILCLFLLTFPWWFPRQTVALLLCEPFDSTFPKQ